MGCPLAWIPKWGLMEKSHMEQSPGHSCKCRQPAAIVASFNPSTEDMQWHEEINLHCYLPLRFGGCFLSQIRWLIQQTSHDVLIPRMGTLGFFVLGKRKKRTFVEHLLKANYYSRSFHEIACQSDAWKDLLSLIQKMKG